MKSLCAEGFPKKSFDIGRFIAKQLNVYTALIKRDEIKKD